MEANKKKRLLLLIDDNPIITGLYKTTFEKAGFDVIFAHDGKTGLSLLDEKRPDGIVLDLLMPGLSGFQVLEEIKKHSSRSATKTVVLTSVEDEKELKKARELGALDCLVKPRLNLAEIVDRVTTLVA